MSVYRLTCSVTGLVYYGSTKKELKVRKNKGWYKCSCKDFVNPIMECVEKVDNIDNLLIREDYWIRNNECVNANNAILNKEKIKQNRIDHKEKKKEYDKNYIKIIINSKKFHCEMCDLTFVSPGKLNRHLNGYRHKLKEKAKELYGENWKDQYEEFKRKRYNENKRNKKISKTHKN